MNKYVIVSIHDVLGKPLTDPVGEEYDSQEDAIKAIPKNSNVQYLIVLKENIDPKTNIPKTTKIVYVQ